MHDLCCQKISEAAPQTQLGPLDKSATKSVAPIFRNFWHRWPFEQCQWHHLGGTLMHGIIYLVGLIVVILAVLSFFGLR